MVALCNTADHYFHPVVTSIFFLSFFFFFSSPNLSGRRLDVYHTSTHDVALVIATLRSRCGHYIFVLWFLSIFFYSTPNLSCRGLDVYRASTHGVALVQI